MSGLRLVVIVIWSLVALPAMAISPGAVDTFSGGSLDNWQKGRVDPTYLSVVATGGPAGAADSYLQSVADGSASFGRLTVFNANQWSSNYVTDGVTSIRMDLQNSGSVPLQIRVGMRNAGGAGFISTAPFNLGVGGGWQSAVFPITLSALTAVGSPGSYATFLSNPFALRILHATTTTNLNGNPVVSTLGIDNVTAVPEPAALAWIGLAMLGLGAAGKRARVGRRPPRLGGEPLEPRALLAVSGQLVDGDLVIQSNAAKDLVTITSSATAYTVSGTGMLATTFAKSSIDSIRVTDTGGVNLAGQLLILGGSSAIADPISVTGIEATLLNNSVSISPYESQAAGDVVFGGPVLLPTGKSLFVSNGAGSIKFLSTIDGDASLAISAIDHYVELAGPVGGKTPLSRLVFDGAGILVAHAPIVVDGRGRPSNIKTGITLGRFVEAAVLDGVGSAVRRCPTGITIEAANALEGAGYRWTRTISNFNVSQNATGILFAHDAKSVSTPVFQNWTITGNKITGNSEHGIKLSADTLGRSETAGITLSKNVITGNKRTGILVDGTPEGLLIQQNTLTNNGAGTLPGDAAIRLTDGLGLARTSVRIDGNAIGFLNPLLPTSVGKADGIQATNLPGLRITGNTLTRTASGIKLTGDFTRGDGSPVLAANALSGNFRGVSLNAATNVTLDGTNTFSLNRSSGVAATGNSAGTVIAGVTVGNPTTGTMKFQTIGLSLDAVAGITITDVKVSGGGYGIWLKSTTAATIDDVATTGCSQAAIRAQGDCQGTTVSALALNGPAEQRVSLDGARGLKIDSLTGTNALLMASGNCAGTTVSGGSITTGGVGLTAAQGLAVMGMTFAEGGAWASGSCVGSTLSGLTVSGGHHGLSLAAAQSLTVANSTFTGHDSAGLYASGNCGGTTITGCAFDDNQNEAATDAAVYGIRLDDVTGLTITACSANRNEASGLRIDGNATGTKISGSTFNENGFAGVSLGAVKGLTLGSGNSATGNANWGLYAINACTGTTVSGSTFSGNSIGGSGGGIALYSTTGITLTGNTVNGNGVFGLFANGNLAGSSLASSTFAENRTGIFLFGVQNLAIKTGTIIQSNLTGLGATADCAGTTVVGTKISGNSQQGVSLGDVTNLTINGLNKIQNNAVGVYASGLCTNTKVNGNLISANDGPGLFLEAAQAFKALNNTVSGNQTFGLRALGVSTGTTVTGNTIVNNGTNISVAATGGTFQKA